MVVTHGSYLVNLASPKADILEKSRQAFLAEMQRCHALGIPYLVFHPGAHMGAGEDAGLETIAASLDHVFERAGGLSVTPLLEVTAGQGSYVGHRFEHLATILDRSKSDRLGICLDTCHLLAAGYDIAEEAGYETVMAEFSRLVGLSKLKADPPQRRQEGAREPPGPPRGRGGGLPGPRDVPENHERPALRRPAPDSRDAGRRR